MQAVFLHSSTGANLPPARSFSFWSCRRFLCVANRAHICTAKAGTKVPLAAHAVPLVYPCLLGLAGAGMAHKQVLTITLLAAPVLLLHVITPLLDIISKEHFKEVKAVPRHLTTSRAQFWSRLLAFVFVPTHIGACLMSYYMLAKMNDTAAQDLAGHFMLLASTGVSSAVGSASAHELIHSRHFLHRAVGELYLLWTWHWGYSRAHHHHHQTVGTPEDHATAAKGETYYQFMPRYILGGWLLAWKAEMQEAAADLRKQQMQEKKETQSWQVKQPFPVLLPWRLIAAVAAQVGITIMLGTVFGDTAAKVHLGAAFISQALLALVDYGLHYGLERSRLVLYHSDHHMAASKPHTDLGLVWPQGYYSQQEDAVASNLDATALRGPLLLPGVPMSAVLLIALFLPPLWFALVNPECDSANAGQRRQARFLLERQLKTRVLKEE